MGEAGLDRRCIWAYGIGLPRTTNLLWKHFPTKYRFSVVNNFYPSIPVYGGLAPILATYILPYSPLWVFGAIGLILVLTLRETKDVVLVQAR